MDMLTPTIEQTLLQLKEDGFPLDEFSVVMVPQLVHMRLQREFIKKWGVNMVVHGMKSIQGYKLLTVDPLQRQYDRTFRSEGDVVILTWPAHRKEPIKFHLDVGSGFSPSP